MASRLTAWRRRVSPLDLAALVTWAAVSVEVWQASADLDPVGGIPARTLAAGLLLLYLLGFAPFSGPPEAVAGRYARIGLFIMAASLLALLLIGPTGTAPVLAIIFAAVATHHLPMAAAAGILVLLNAAMLALFVFAWRAPNPLLMIALYAGFQAFAALASYAMRRANEAAAELREVNAHLLATRSLLAETARDGERLRLSRELHDVSGHKLTALRLNLELLARADDVADRRELRLARELLEDLLGDIRSVVSQLRRHDGIDLREALQRLAEPMPIPRVHVQVAADARVDSAEHAATLIRVAQEGLTNAARHASPRNVWIRFARHDGYCELVVEDDGRATAPIRPGTGLTGMRERVIELGGELEITQAVSGGLRIRARLPRASEGGTAA